MQNFKLKLSKVLSNKSITVLSLILVSVTTYLLWQSFSTNEISYEFTETEDSEEPLIVDYKEPTNSYNSKNLNDIITEDKHELTPDISEVVTPVELPAQVDLPQEEKPEAPKYVENEVIVEIKDPNEVPDIANVKSVEKIDDTTYKYVVNTAEDLKTAITELNNSDAVKFAEPNQIYSITQIPNDVHFDKMWSLNNTGQTGGLNDADIDAPEAWDITTGSEDIIIAVIDTGVDYNHPDIANNILRDASGNVIGYDFVNNDADPMDDHGHGTHVAGTIAASSNNSTGITGICQRCKIMPIKFLDHGGSGSLEQGIQSIQFAIDHGADIINNSWGGSGYTQSLDEVITNAYNSGIVVVSGAGNSNSSYPFYPAAYQHSLSVAATGNMDIRAPYSNYGGTIDISAPGGGLDAASGCRTDYTNSILSLGASGNVIMWNNTPANCKFEANGERYLAVSGTSMATPHVAGAFGLLKSYHPDWTAEQLIMHMLSTTDDLSTQNPDYLNQLGTGRLNIYNALTTPFSNNFEGLNWMQDEQKYTRYNPDQTELFNVDIAFYDSDEEYVFYAYNGQTIYFKPSFKNISGTTPEATVSLTSNNPCINISNSSAPLPSVSGWSEFTIPEAFEITIGQDCDPTTMVTFNFKVQDTAANNLINKDLVLPIGYEFQANILNIKNSSGEIVHNLKSNSNFTIDVHLFELKRYPTLANELKVVLTSSNSCVSFPQEAFIPAMSSSTASVNISNIPVITADCSANNIIDLKVEIKNNANQLFYSDTTRLQADTIDSTWYKSDKYLNEHKSEDLNGDGVKENIFFNQFSNVEVLDNNLANLTGWPFNFDVYLQNKISNGIGVSYDHVYNAIGNIDADSDKEIIVLCKKASGNVNAPLNVLLVLNPDGTVDEPLTEIFNIVDREPYFLTLSDLDRNSVDEIIFVEEGSYSSTTNVHNAFVKIIFNPGVAKEVKSIEIPNTDAVFLSLVNLDEDAQMEIIMSSLNPSTDLMKIYRADLNLPYDFQLTQIGQYTDYDLFPLYHNLITDDLNNDGQVEIIFNVGGSTQMQEYFLYGSTVSKDQLTYVIDLSGNVLPGWPKPGRSPRPADLNGDGIKEVITTEYSAEKQIGYSSFYKYLESKNLYGFTGDLIWEKSLNYRSYIRLPLQPYRGADLIADLNSDGNLDLITTPSYGEYDYHIISFDYAGNTLSEFYPGLNSLGYTKPSIYQTSEQKIGVMGLFISHSARVHRTYGVDTKTTYSDESIYWPYEKADLGNTNSKVALPPLIESTDLALQIQAPTDISKGEQLNYSLKIRAVGTEALAENVTFSASLAENTPLTFVSATKGTCNPVENLINCTIDSINSTEEVTILLSLDTNLINDPDQIVANFTIGTTTTEINTSNNSKTLTTVFKLNSPVLIEPKANTGVFKPTYKWNEVDRASKYRFRVELNPSKFFEAEYTKESICLNGTCQINPDYSIINYGTNYTWSVIAVHANGLQSTKVSEVFKPLAPTRVTILSPGLYNDSNTVLNDFPVVYKWNQVSLATKYTINITKVATPSIIIDRPLESNEYSCIDGVCSITIPNTSNGTYRWTVMGVNDFGNGSVSLPFSYRVEYIKPSNETIAVNKPEYKFGLNSMSGTNTFTNFIIRKFDSNGLNPTVIHNTAQITSNSLPCPSGVCTLNPNLNLTNGIYNWSILVSNTLNGVTTTQQVNSGKFTVQTPAPAENVVEIAPINTTVTQSNVEFSWQKDPNATEYKVHIKSAAGTVYTQNLWYPANTICGTDNICKVTQNYLTVETNYLWGVEGRTLGGSSNSLMSNPFTYKVLSPSNETITTHLPSYQWRQVGGATYTSFVIYKVNADGTKTVFNNSGTTPTTSFITCANNLCTANRNIVLPNGKYSWTANYQLLPNTTNRTVTSLAFIVSVPLPGNVVEVSPKDNIQVTDILQEFTWQADAVATEYRIFLNKVVGTTATALPTSTTWYQKSAICGADTICKVKLNVPLAEGDYAWTVQGQTIGGVGVQTAPGTTQNRFKVLPRGTFNLLEPVGFYSGSGRPTFKWEQIGTNRNYTISSATGTPWVIPGTTSTANFPLSFNINATNSTCDAGICSFTPATPLRYLTRHQFKVTYTSSLGQVIPSITSKIFVLPNVVSPINKISPANDTRPVANQVFKWTRDPLAVNYILVIQRTDVTTGTIYKSFGTGICSTTTNVCTASFSQTYAAANYRWYVYGLKETLASTGITANVMGAFITLNSTNGTYTFNPTTVPANVNPTN